MCAKTRWIVLSGALLAAWLLGVSRGVAADCLPPELEKASPEAQTAYWNRLRLESQDQKIEVGRIRYNRRVEIKRSIARDLQRAVALRMAETSAWHPTEARTDDPARYAVPSNFLLWSGVILGILFLLLKHRLPQRAGPTA